MYARSPPVDSLTTGAAQYCIVAFLTIVICGFACYVVIMVEVRDPSVCQRRRRWRWYRVICMTLCQPVLEMYCKTLLRNLSLANELPQLKRCASHRPPVMTP
jgi:hypothetical protein